MANDPVFLKLSGVIAENNTKEFVQTFKYVFSQLSAECLQKNLSVDCLSAGHYYFFSLWSSPGSLKNFMKSEEFLMIEGAFETLGAANKKLNGQLMDIEIFRS